MEGLEGEILELIAEEGRDAGQVIVRTESGKVGILRKGEKSKNIRPGDVVRGLVEREYEKYFVFRPLEIVERAPNDANILPLTGIIEDEGRRAIIRLKKTPALEPVFGKRVKVVIMAGGVTNEN